MIINIGIGVQVGYCLESSAKSVNSDYESVMRSEKSFVITAILCFLLGTWGIHRFYVGKIGTGILMFLTGGGLWVWTIIDFIRIVTGNFKDSDGMVISNAGASPPPTTAAPKKPLVKWFALGSLGLLVLIIVLVVAIPGGDSNDLTRSSGGRSSQGTTVSPRDRVTDAVADTLGKSNRGMNFAASDSRRVKAVGLDGGKLFVQWAINDNITSGLMKAGARRDVSDILKAIQETGVLYDNVLVVGTFALVDLLGNESEEEVVEASYNRSTVESINWDNFIFDNVYRISDGVVIHRLFRD